eukprot:TRINITY_DN11440_c0_g1_i1.p4 TRINITY_DN11440_c0_g1~~TRINITY_DN11440_c0_g1_i1.p4  ORF type:complete len:196 (+),score=66.74 TRINITY_DN11440_c0_g1_i1:85-588(+)
MAVLTAEWGPPTLPGTSVFYSGRRVLRGRPPSPPPPTAEAAAQTLEACLSEDARARWIDEELRPEDVGTAPPPPYSEPASSEAPEPEDEPEPELEPEEHFASWAYAEHCAAQHLAAREAEWAALRAARSVRPPLLETHLTPQPTQAPRDAPHPAAAAWNRGPAVRAL